MKSSMKHYKVTYRSLLFAFGIAIVVALVYLMIYGYCNTPGRRQYFLPASGVFAVPTILFFLLHFQFYFQNRYTTLTIDLESGIFDVNRHSFKLEDIRSVELHRNFRDGKGAHLPLVTDEYFYFRIELRTGAVFYLTSLLINDSEEIDFGQPVKKIWRMIPFLKRK